MADMNCSACEELRQTAPDFVVNGLSDDNCTSLANGTGLNPSNENDNCTDLDNINDCLIGNMATEVEAYDVCDWKEFMKNFIPNVWTTLKAIICAICGVWAAIRRHECEIDALYEGASFAFGEATSGKESSVVAGKGVSYKLASSSQTHASDISIIYVGGALSYVHGSIVTFTESFTDADNESRAGNSNWNFEASNFDMPNGGELLYEIRIKKSEYPMLERFFRGEAWNAGGGQHFFHAGLMAFDGDNIPSGQTARYAYGQHGWCDDDGTPSSTGYSSGHAVPQGWIYIQNRMIYVADLPVGNVTDGAGASKQGTRFSPHGYMGLRVSREAIDC